MKQFIVQLTTTVYAETPEEAGEIVDGWLDKIQYKDLPAKMIDLCVSKVEEVDEYPDPRLRSAD